MTDYCGLLVSAGQGAFENSNLDQHIQTAVNLGTKSIVVLITDMEKGGLRRWSQNRYMELKGKVEPLLLKHF